MMAPGGTPLTQDMFNEALQGGLFRFAVVGPELFERHLPSGIALHPAEQIVQSAIRSVSVGLNVEEDVAR